MRSQHFSAVETIHRHHRDRAVGGEVFTAPSAMSLSVPHPFSPAVVRDLSAND
jgi:hypothetical protein